MRDWSSDVCSSDLAIIANQYGTPSSTVKDKINTASSAVGGGQAFDNRPAYYELAYIIKL